MSGMVIQGSFPHGIPRHLSPRAEPVQRTRPPAYADLARDAHRRSAGVAQPSMHGAFVLPPHLAAFGRRPGQRLAPALQQKMESFFKADFSRVEVHVGPEAASIGALAFTQGSHIYFAPGQYRPDTVAGQQLLGHELTHVVQQRAGRVRHPFGHGVAVVQDPGLEAEAERMGAQAALHRPVLQPQAPLLLHANPALHVSGPVRLAPGKYRITAGSPGQPAGSVTLHSRGSAMELTDLGVDTAHRKRGLGHALLASALRAGARLGKSTVRLASEDNGTGALTRWYRGMGFRQVGVDPRGLPRLEAPIRRVMSSVRQARWSSPALPFPARLVQRAAQSASTYKQSGENTCWAAAFAMVKGVSESSVKVYAKLDSSVNALSYDDTAPLVKELGLTLVAKWHEAAMAGKLPLAVGLPEHWVVVTAVTKNKSNTRATTVTYMDPWTGKTATVDAEAFMKLEPTIGVYK